MISLSMQHRLVKLKAVRPLDCMLLGFSLVSCRPLISQRYMDANTDFSQVNQHCVRIGTGVRLVPQLAAEAAHLLCR